MVHQGGDGDKFDEILRMFKDFKLEIIARLDQQDARLERHDKAIQALQGNIGSEDEPKRVARGHLTNRVPYQPMKEPKYENSSSDDDHQSTHNENL